MAEEKQEQGAQEPVQKKKGKKWLVLLIVVIMVLAGGAAAVYFIFPERINAYIEQHKEKKRQQARLTPGVMVVLEPFLFNLPGSTSKYAKVSLGIEVKDAKVADEVKRLMPAIRDRSLSVLGSKQMEVLMDVTQRDALKKEIAEGLKKVFKEESDLKAVYVTDVIIQ